MESTKAPTSLPTTTNSFLHDFQFLEVSDSTAEGEESILLTDVNLEDLLRAYENDRPEDEETIPVEFALDHQEETYVFCNSLAALQPVDEALEDHCDPVLQSLLEEAADLLPHVRWRVPADEQTMQALQSPTSSPPKKRFKVVSSGSSDLGHDSLPNFPLPPTGSVDSTPAVSSRQIRSKAWRKRGGCKRALDSVPEESNEPSACAPQAHSHNTAGAIANSNPSTARNQTGKDCRRRRASKRLKEVDLVAKRLRRIIQKNLENQRVLISSNDVRSASVTKTGWTGLTMKKRSEQEVMLDLFHSGQIWHVLYHFQRISFDINQSLLIFDAHRHLLVVRGRQAEWVVKGMPELDRLLKKLVGNLPEKRPKLWRRYAANPRGNHIPFLLGWHRQYTEMPTLSEQHRLSMKRSDDFINSPLIQNLTKYVCSILKLYFPECAARYQSAVDFWAARAVRAQFGLFFNFCPNLPLVRGRVHTLPHADRKNIAGGLCALMAYHRKKSFASKTKAWLVIWELGMVVELPVGVLLLYPSALFYHFNIDITDLDIVGTDGPAPDPTKRDEYPSWSSEAEGRGSLVWFNQASMIQSAQLGYLTINQAKKAGVKATTDFKADVDRYFTPASPFTFPLPTDLTEGISESDSESDL